jgi:PAS domain S-box-containing protein
MYNKLKQENRSIEEVLKVAFEKNAAPTAIFNLDTTIAMVNDAYCEISGYSREEVVGMSWTKQIPPGELERLKEYNQQRLANPLSAPTKYEFAFYTKNGKIKYGYTSIATLLEHGLLIMSFADITAEKLIAQELVRQNQKMQKLIEIRDKDIALSVSQLVANKEDNQWLLSKIEELIELAKPEPQLLMPVILEIKKNIARKLQLDTWEKVQQRFQISYPDSLSKILKKHPALTPAEIKLCALLTLNLDTKEIAIVLNLEFNSIRIARARLRKKLELSSEENLTAYLMTFK